MNVPSLRLQEVWAKSPVNGSTGETLIDHTEAVVCALAKIAELRPSLHLESEIPRLWHWAFWTCCLHDLGKAATGFQQQLREDYRWGHRHEVLSLAFLDWLRPEPEDRRWLAAAIASHHKDLSDLQNAYPADVKPEEDEILTTMVQQLPQQTVEALQEVISEAAKNWRIQYGFASLGVHPIAFARETLDSFYEKCAQRIISNLKDYYQLARSLRRGECSEKDKLTSLLLRGLIITADHTASAHIQPPVPTLRCTQELLDRLGRNWESLYEHQRACASFIGSTILTAPTGTGKTEASLLWAAKQCEETAAPRLFYVLPFQASMNAMYQRLERLFQGEVGMQHGRSLHALYRVYLQTDSTPKKAAMLARSARNLARLHAYPVKVLSPYQLLKACFRIRGYEAALTDCFGGLFIFDEMHAYEPKRLAMIIGMIGYLHTKMKARFCIMTATMPPPIIERLHNALGNDGTIESTPDLARQFQRHRVQLLDDEVNSERSLDEMMEWARSGKSVLVCCNTVRRAQETYEQIRKRMNSQQIEVHLLHSRFTARDRLHKEGAWLKDPAQPVQPQGVLVATQVVEVSLNLDFDTIFTEPAPLEALLQRFGRVNRLGHRSPMPVHIFRGPVDGQAIYDPKMITATLRVLENACGKVVDEMEVSQWLREIYVGQILEEWSQQFTEAAREFEEVCLNNLYAFCADNQLEEAFFRLFDHVEVLPACLEDEYKQLAEDDPLRSAEILVGISWRQFYALRAKGLVRSPAVQGEPPRLDVPYSAELGLQLP